MKKIIIILIVTLNILAQEGDWKQFVPEYNHILFPTDVTVIKVDRFNNKWIGTSGYDNEYGTVGGLVKFDGENWTQYTQTNSDLPDGYITAIGFDDEDNTWIGMKDSGIVMIDNGILSRIMGPQNIIQKGEVKSIVTDKAGNIWVLYRNVTYHSNLYKDSALLKFDGNIWSDLKLDSLLPQGSSINEITISKDGKLYCGSYEKVFIYNYMSWSEIQTPVEENVVCLEFDRRHNLWIGTTGNTSSNIWKYENNIWEKPGNINTGGKPSDLLFEKNGNIWISSNATNKGLVRYSGIIWDYLNTENSPILSSSISSIAQDSNGVIWFGSFYGACTYDENIWKYYAVSEGLPGRRINKIVVDDQNNKWIGTNKYGLVKFDGNRWTFFNMSNSIVPHNQINDITIDSIGKIWIATKKGFLSYHNEIWNAYIETNNERVIGEITKVECSPNGELWTIIKYDTLLCFNGTDFTEFHSGNSSLPENSIFLL